MKRFWTEARAERGAEGHAILLDGKKMHVPGGSVLLVPGAVLAEALAAEWQAAGGEKGGDMSLEMVPLTRLAGTAQERIAPDPAPVADALARYAETDLLCYRAEHPLPLVVRQAREWQPWLDWIATEHGARLQPTAGVTHLAQDPAALAVVQRLMAAQTPLALAALGIAVPALGSAVLGLALAAGKLDATQAFALATLDESFQAEHWGLDAEAVRRRANVASDIALAERFLALARAG